MGRNEELYVARGYTIYRSEDWGASWERDCYVPPVGWKPPPARLRLLSRLLRYYISALEVLHDGTRIAVARDGIYQAGPGEAEMSRVFRIDRGGRPINLAVDGSRVLFGEYLDSGRDDNDPRIYVSEDCGRTFEARYSFPKGLIGHVHNILVDPYCDVYWVLTGDFDQHPGIAALSRDFRTLEWLNRGTQRCRAVSALVEPDCLVYGTDSQFEDNFIVSMDKESGRISEIRPIKGSSLYATTFGPVRVISTCAEPGIGNTTREVCLYASGIGHDWTAGEVHEKDRHHMKLFQFGLLALPYAYNSTSRGMYSGQAVKNSDDRIRLLEFS